MHKWAGKLAAVVTAAGIVGGMAPAASAQTTAVPCEGIFGEYICAQIRETGDFVDQTVANAAGAVDEWRKRAAAEGEELADYVFCVLSGACPIVSS